MKATTMICGACVAALLATAAHANDGVRGGKLFDRADANGDGQISAAESRALRTQIFNRADANGDGSITRQEMTDAMQRRANERASQRVAKRFEKMDANRDGAVARSEFEDRGARRFEEIDANNDGVLTRDEIRQMRHKRRGG